MLSAREFLSLHDNSCWNSSTLLLFSAEGNECIKANAESCGDCIQVGAKCGWCTDTVSTAHMFGLSDSYICHRCLKIVMGNRNSCLVLHEALFMSHIDTQIISASYLFQTVNKSVNIVKNGDFINRWSQCLNRLFFPSLLHSSGVWWLNWMFQ